MKLRSLSIVVLLNLIVIQLLAQSPTGSRNYVMETTVKVAGIKTISQLSSLPVDSANRTITYLDGLGRPIQKVQWQASPSKKDIVQFMVYDALGREALKYLPYTEQSSSDISFKTSPIANQQAFYGTSSWDANISRTAHPFSQTVFEASPLNRVIEQGSPGATWQPYSSSITTSGHTIKMGNSFNATNEVALWKPTSSGASGSTNYASNTLFKTIKKDENWTSGKSGTIEEFTDFEGKLVLKRAWETESISLSTYYVYDDFSNLRYVIPPAVSATSFSESDAVFKNFIYGYHHDGRKRVVEKKIPGKGWEHIVYNKLDQMVFTQDSLQRANSKWQFIKMDALGRMIITGLCSNSSARNTLQASVDGQTYLWESKDNTNASGTSTGYTNVSLPTSGVSELNIINYYDDYDFYGNSFGSPTPPQVNGGRTTSLITGTKINIIGTNTMLLSVNYYDEKGRVLQSETQNHLSGTDVTNNTYDFEGKLIASTRIHSANSTTTTIANAFIFDHVGRKISTKENINNQGEIVLNKFEYNEIGQLKQKSLHSSDNGSTFLQTTKYAYNPRGWMKDAVSPEFNLKLGYDTTSNPQFNGNISTQLWGSGYGNKFLYTYDKLNRLTNATSTGISMSEELTYDLMGNITTLSRDGGTTGIYNYTTGNQLSSITNGPLATSSYGYDGNGNAITDGRNAVTFTYNHLNLPATASKSGLSLSYTYDAMGQKLKKVNSISSTTTDYAGGIQYTNNSIEFIQTEEGRALNNGGTFSYQYDLKDHLGNVRYSFDIYGGAVRKLQEDDYYALGLRHAITGGTNGYLYNGKELQEELGQYDYGARFYDPVIGRWNVVDPLSEKMRRFSPYSYAFDNPTRFIDPDGRSPEDVTEDEDPGKRVIVNVTAVSAIKLNDDLKKATGVPAALLRGATGDKLVSSTTFSATISDGEVSDASISREHAVLPTHPGGHEVPFGLGEGLDPTKSNQGSVIQGENGVVGSISKYEAQIGTAGQIVGKTFGADPVTITQSIGIALDPNGNVKISTNASSFPSTNYNISITTINSDGTSSTKAFTTTFAQSPVSKATNQSTFSTAQKPQVITYNINK